MPRRLMRRAVAAGGGFPALGLAASALVHVGILALGAFLTREPGHYAKGGSTELVQFLVPPDRVSTHRIAEERIEWMRIGIPEGWGISDVAGESLGSEITAAPRRGDRGDDPEREFRRPRELDELLGGDLVFSAVEVDSIVERSPESAAPFYPAELLALQVEGSVRAEYIVTASGTVDSASFNIVTATHPAFAAAVLEAVPRMRFRPAIAAGRPVAQRVEQTFEFRIGVRVKKVALRHVPVVGTIARADSRPDDSRRRPPRASEDSMPPARATDAEITAPAGSADPAGVSSSGSRTKSAAVPAGGAAALHPLDRVSFGKIVQVRERLLAAQAAGTQVYRFESGDPSFSVAPHVLEAVARAGREGRTHYVPNDGIPELRKALAAKLTTTNGIPDVTAGDVFVTNGAMHALYVTFAALLMPGDEVIIPDPMWTEVAENVKLAGGVPVGVPLRFDDGYEYRPADVERAITSRTRALFINTPHNPTGAVLSADTLRALVDVARRHDLDIVSDEAYEDILFAPNEHHSTASLAGDWAHRVISIFSFSKSHAMSGLRVGYVVTADAHLKERIPKALRCTINGVNALAQWAALAAVTGPQDHLDAMRAEYLVRRDVMLAALDGIPGVRPFVPRGAFYAWAEVDASLYRRLGVRGADALSDRLAAEGIGSAPGDAFGRASADALRFAFSCSTEMVRAGAPVLRAALLGAERGTASAAGATSAA